jgi:2-polyprenyl-6-methoxyphenol hydroxylase-like FAD-dependent oxidoreductase
VTVNVSACVVGGGPAGLLLGLLLAKRGAQVLVLEGHEDFEREFRGEVLQPSTSHLLDELGLLEYVKAQPHSLLEAAMVRLNGRDIGEFSFKRIAPEYPYAIWMPQPIFLAAMLRKAQDFPSFQCWMGAKVGKLIEENGRVVGVSGVRHGKEPFEVRADVVVGADGRHSTLARLGGFTPEYEHHDFDVIWFTIEQPPGWSSTFYISLGDTVRGLMLPKYPHHIQAGILLPTGEWRRWREQGVAAVAAGGRHPPREGVGARRPAPDRRRRPHHEPGGRHRRQRGDRDGRRRRPGAVPASRAWTDRARASAGGPAAARGRREDAPPAAARRPARAAEPGQPQSARALADPAGAAAPASLAAPATGAAPPLLRRAAAAARSLVQLP